MRFLLFTLYAPMGAMGTSAVGELRMSGARPARAALVGLASAALGLRRDQAEHIDRLQTRLHWAVRVDAPGVPLMDYHTTQVPGGSAKYRTRRDELMAGKLNTVLSEREWRTDVFCTVAVWTAEGEGGLERLADALRKPTFTLYFGRKSGPLGLPTAPEVLDADSFVEALRSRRRSTVELQVLERLGADPSSPVTVAFDADAPGVPPSLEYRIERTRDVIEDRLRWQFSGRQEAVAEIRT